MNAPGTRFDRRHVEVDDIEVALVELASGRPVAVLDDADRENEGDLILSAEKATPGALAFLIRHTSGVLCAPLPGARLDALRLPPMVEANEDPKHTAYSISVDARDKITTGISAADRARTVNLLADPSTSASALTRPGHVFPLRAVPGGVLARRGHTEAAVDLTRLAGLEPAGVIGELSSEDGSIMAADATREFCDTHGLALITIADLVAYIERHNAAARSAPAPAEPAASGTANAGPERAPIARRDAAAAVGSAPQPGRGETRSHRTRDRGVTLGSEVTLPTQFGDFRARCASDPVTGEEHLVLTHGTIGNGTIVRLHSECATGDIFASLRCDCGPQLHAALAEIVAAGAGVVIYLRGHEGRGIGLAAKIETYALQEKGLDTIDANLELGYPADARDFGAVPEILRALDLSSVSLLTHNPHKVEALADHGIEIREAIPLPVAATVWNRRYLTTKRDRLGHRLDLPAAISEDIS